MQDKIDEAINLQDEIDEAINFQKLSILVLLIILNCKKHNY